MHAGAPAQIAAVTTTPGLVIAATGAFAVLVTASSFVFMITGKRHVLFHLNVFGTIVHEAGHASLSVLTGGGVYRFQITGPDAGYLHHWYPSRLSNIAISAAGYAMPTLAGLGAAALLHRGHPGAVLTITVVILVLLLVVSRDMRTVGTVLAVGVLLFAAVYWGPSWLQSCVAYVEAWLLLTSEISGLATIVLNRIRGRRNMRDDADNLARDSRVPAPMWIAGWFALIGWGLWIGVPLLWS
jgi:hypothetical protein